MSTLIILVILFTTSWLANPSKNFRPYLTVLNNPYFISFLLILLNARQYCFKLAEGCLLALSIKLWKYGLKFWYYSLLVAKQALYTIEKKTSLLQFSFCYLGRTMILSLTAVIQYLGNLFLLSFVKSLQSLQAFVYYLRKSKAL